MSTESQTDDEIKALLAILEDPNLIASDDRRAIRLVGKTAEGRDR
jgi:hypothetical protein